jgi:hypothetical protein
MIIDTVLLWMSWHVEGVTRMLMTAATVDGVSFLIGYGINRRRAKDRY